MARINTCLKRTFMGFNLLFALIGGVIVSLAVVSQILTSAEPKEQELEGRTTGLICLYVMGALTMLLGLLGAYGAHKEHKVSLIVFLVSMVMGGFVMIRAGIPAAVARPQVEGYMEERFRMLLPLDTALPKVKDMADSLQTQLHCCGLFSYHDWNDDIPSSCLCSPMEQEESGQCKEVGYAYRDRSRTIYSKPCFPIMMHYILLLADITLGIIFTLAALAVLGMVLSSIMIHQLRQPSRPAVLFSIPTIFTSGPPKYQELVQPPPPY